MENLEPEIWKEYKGYKVSSHGNVIGLRGFKLRFGMDKDGYFKFDLHYAMNMFKSTRVHRLIGQLFVPNPDNKPCINHLDGDKQNNYYKNLAWATVSENTQHAYDNNLASAKGIRNSQAILNEEKVILIRRLFADGASKKDLGNRFGVHRLTIHDVVKRRKWRHVL